MFRLAIFLGVAGVQASVNGGGSCTRQEDCSHQGICLGGKCTCPVGYTCEDCSQQCTSSQLSVWLAEGCENICVAQSSASRTRAPSPSSSPQPLSQLSACQASNQCVAKSLRTRPIQKATCEGCFPGTSGECISQAGVCFSSSDPSCPGGSSFCSSDPNVPCGGCASGTSGPCKEAGGTLCFPLSTARCPPGTSFCTVGGSASSSPAPLPSSTSSSSLGATPTATASPGSATPSKTVGLTTSSSATPSTPQSRTSLPTPSPSLRVLSCECWEARIKCAQETSKEVVQGLIDRCREDFIQAQCPFCYEAGSSSSFPIPIKYLVPAAAGVGLLVFLMTILFCKRRRQKRQLAKVKAQPVDFSLDPTQYSMPAVQDVRSSIASTTVPMVNQSYGSSVVNLGYPDPAQSYASMSSRGYPDPTGAQQYASSISNFSYPDPTQNYASMGHQGYPDPMGAQQYASSISNLSYPDPSQNYAPLGNPGYPDPMGAQQFATNQSYAPPMTNPGYTASSLGSQVFPSYNSPPPRYRNGRW